MDLVTASKYRGGNYKKQFYQQFYQQAGDFKSSFHNLTALDKKENQQRNRRSEQLCQLLYPT